MDGGDNYQCLEGKADANRMIMPYLNKFDWEETSENYFKQQFNFESNYLDNKLILLVRKIQAKRIKCYLCTDQDENRTKFLLNEMGFGNIFDGYFISYQIGYRKCNDNFWMHVIEKLKKDYQNIKPDEIVFFDDIQKNIDTASRIGIKTFLFKDTAQFEKDLNSVCM